MNTAEIWLHHFREVVSKEIDNAGGKDSNGYRAVESKTGIAYDYIYQMYTGKPVNKPKRPTIEVMEKIDQAYANGRERGWTNIQPNKSSITDLANSLVPVKQIQPQRDLPPQDMSMALFNAYSSLVRVLHRNGTLDAADLANDIGNTLDFRRSSGIESAEQNRMLEIVYKSVLAIEKHESDLKNLKAEHEKRLQELQDQSSTDEQV